MLKIFIKHFIYEASIDALFNALISNFALGRKQELIQQIMYLTDKLILNNKANKASYIIIPHDIYDRLMDMDDDSIDTILEMMENPEKYNP